jgi:hypothetical protein
MIEVCDCRWCAELCKVLEDRLPLRCILITLRITSFIFSLHANPYFVACHEVEVAT